MSAQQCNPKRGLKARREPSGYYLCISCRYASASQGYVDAVPKHTPHSWIPLQPPMVAAHQWTSGVGLSPGVGCFSLGTPPTSGHGVAHRLPFKVKMGAPTTGTAVLKRPRGTGCQLRVQLVTTLPCSSQMLSLAPTAAPPALQNPWPGCPRTHQIGHISQDSVSALPAMWTQSDGMALWWWEKHQEDATDWALSTSSHGGEQNPYCVPECLTATPPMETQLKGATMR